MHTLSDNQQALLVLISMILLAVAGVSVPAGAPWYVALILGALGAIGMAIKEYAGAKPSKTE